MALKSSKSMMQKKINTSEVFQLEEVIKPFLPVLDKALESILDQEVSDYPIFVVHQHELEVGVKLIDSTNTNGAWTIHASTLEEFISKQIITMDRLDSFKKIYKDPSTHYCLFVLNELGANFIFLPRKNKHHETDEIKMNT